MTDEAYYEGRREVRTFADLHHGAFVMGRFARESESGSYYTAMSSLLLSAFTFEAYVNHLGALRLPFWEQIEAIRVMDKYAVLLKHLGIEADFSRQPDQTLRALFKFRVRPNIVWVSLLVRLWGPRGSSTILLKEVQSDGDVA